MSDRTAAVSKPRNNKVMHWIRQRRINKNWQFYVMLILPLAWYFIFCYMPMPGVILGFKKYKALLGIYGSPRANPWYKWFEKYYASPYFARTIGNTFILSFMSLLQGFPLPILLALLLNELRNKHFQKFVQNITYIPHFLSTVVLVGMMTCFTNRYYGLVNKLYSRTAICGAY